MLPLDDGGLFLCVMETVYSEDRKFLRYAVNVDSKDARRRKPYCKLAAQL